MRLDPNPIFRKIITPWYDSPLICWVILAAMVIVIFFSITGIVAAFDYNDYKRFIKVPAALLLFSLILVLSVSLRLLRLRDHQKED